MADGRQSVMQGLLTVLGARRSSEGPLHGSPSNQDLLDSVTHMDPSFQPKWLRTTTAHPDAAWGKNVDVSKVLVLYTGGTIGMKSVNKVYCPAPNYLVKSLKSMPIFHDKDFELEFVEEFRTKEAAAPLVLPATKSGKRVVYSVWEYEPLLDSCNMTMTDWARLAMDIKKYYSAFDGFVVLHGTDTMAYTASALSFMMEDLGKPVILTGSQIPIFETRSDGRDNFLGALIIAGEYSIPEVCVYFNNKLLRGNRSTKVDSGNLDAFKSPNLPPLAESEIDIQVNWQIVFRPPGMEQFDVHVDLSPHVGLLRLFPSITKETVSAFLQPPMEGVVIQTYGAGNGPDSREDLMTLLRQASDRGVILVNITQCSRGSVSVSYAAGKALFDAGIVPGGDMTPEAALTKLSYVLGKTSDTDERKKMMQTNLRGEMRLIFDNGDDVRLSDFPIVEKLRDTMKLSSGDELQLLKNALFPALLCSSARNADLDTLEQLRDAGALFSQADYDGRTCLHIAASEGHEDVVRYLLDYGTPVHVSLQSLQSRWFPSGAANIPVAEPRGGAERDRYGHTPLDDAIRFKHHSIIKMLRKTGAHLHHQPYMLGTQLCIAATDQLDNMKSWIFAGADINQGDYDARTALHIAVCHNKEDMVRLLMNHGADPTCRDNNGKTAAEEAARLGYTHLTDLLQPAVLFSDIVKMPRTPVHTGTLTNGRKANGHPNGNNSI